MKDLVAGPAWVELMDRLGASDAREGLAVSASFLKAHGAAVRSAIPGVAWAHVDQVRAELVASPLVDGAATLEAAKAAAAGATTDADAAVAVVDACVALDRVLRVVDPVAEDDPPPPLWGPYAPLSSIGGAPLRLIAWGSHDGPGERQDVLNHALRHHRLLAEPHGGLGWDIAALGDVLPDAARRVLHDVLRACVPVRVGVWPGTVDPPITTVGPCAVVNGEGEAGAGALDDVRAALAWARDEEVTVLVLPELYLPAALEPDLRTIRGDLDPALSEAGRVSPLLTVVGLGHRAGAAPGRWVNDAVVIDHRGRTLARYRKVNDLVVGQGLGECLEPGGSTLLRAAPFGWLAVSTCLDLFAPSTHGALYEAAPALVATPSLSPSTRPHEAAAMVLGSCDVTTVVANRRLDGPSDEAPSFVRSATGTERGGTEPTWWDWDPVTGAVQPSFN